MNFFLNTYCTLLYIVPLTDHLSESSYVFDIISEKYRVEIHQMFHRYFVCLLY